MNEDTRPLMVTIRCLTYNHEPYIRQCLEGFVMQKTNFRFEAIVHDDASTDGTAAIVREYAEKYPDIIKPIFETENQWSKHDGSLRRIMEAHTHGKYIALCEGDDYWIDPLKLQKQVDFMEKHPNISLCGSNGLVLADNFCKRIKYFNNIAQSRELTNEEVICFWTMPTASLLYRNHVVENYPEWTYDVVNGDQLLQLMALLYGNVYCFCDITCVYRQIAGGSILSNKLKKKRTLAVSKLLYLYENYYDTYKNASNEFILKKKIKSLRKQYDNDLVIEKCTFLLHPIIAIKYAFKCIRNIVTKMIWEKLHNKQFRVILD